LAYENGSGDEQIAAPDLILDSFPSYLANLVSYMDGTA
jgi:hypothetical protein